MKQKVFLLADDDSDDTEMFCDALREIDEKVVCHCVENGEEVFKKLIELNEKPDLIFLDINMPMMNGWECIKLLKENETYRHIPVVFYTTSSHKREIDTAMDLGVLCFFTKPSDFIELTQVLRVIVKNLGTELAGSLQRMQAGGFKYIYTNV